MNSKNNKNPLILVTQNTKRNDLAVINQEDDTLSNWLELYFQLEVTTQMSSQKVQRRDLFLFISFIRDETGSDRRMDWTPRLSQAFKSSMQKQMNENGLRRWNDRTINRVLAHLKTFSKWIHRYSPFPLDNPMAKIKNISEASLLDVERAITPVERRRILDAADLLLEVGGVSKDRKRYKNASKRPKRKDYRPYRNRAIVYTLIETGMRRAAITSINVQDVDFKRKRIKTEEKGGIQHHYLVSKEGLEAIYDYKNFERGQDEDFYHSPTLFLPTSGSQNKSGQLNPDSINRIWKQICKTAGVEGKSPHSARHAMGRHLAQKTGNLAAVQRQLGHKNAAYSLQYTRITSDELGKALDDRD